MIRTILLKRNLRIVLVALLVVSFLSMFTVGVASAQSAQMNKTSTAHSSCTYWATEAEWTGTVNHFGWDESVLSFRACGSGQYLGKASTHACLTMPNPPADAARLWNYWYLNGVPVNDNTEAWLNTAVGNKNLLSL